MSGKGWARRPEDRQAIERNWPMKPPPKRPKGAYPVSLKGLKSATLKGKWR